jgi:hypothetical protein
MPSRRFVLLAAVLVTLNVALWLASPGLALRRALIQQFFGQKLVRAEAVYKSPVGGSADWRFDRGVITSVNASQLTLREADTKVQTIQLSSMTRVIRLGRRLPLSVLAPGWRVFVTWPQPNGVAQSVDVERVPRGRSRQLGQ